MPYGKVRLRDPSGRQLEVPRRWAILHGVLWSALPKMFFRISGWPVGRATRMRLTLEAPTATKFVRRLGEVMQSPEEEERFRRRIEFQSRVEDASDFEDYYCVFYDPEITTHKELTHMDIHRDYVPEFVNLCRRIVFESNLRYGWDHASRQWALGVLTASDSERRPWSPARLVGRERALDV